MAVVINLIKTLIDIKVDITATDEHSNKMGSDYICNDKEFASFKQWVINQETIALYFKDLDYVVVHVLDNCFVPSYVPSTQLRTDIPNLLQDTTTTTSIQLADSVTTLAVSQASESMILV